MTKGPDGHAKAKACITFNISISESWNWSIFTHFLKNLFWFLAFWNRYSWVNHCGMWVDFRVDSYTYRRLGMIFSPYIFHVLFLFCWTYGISVSRVLCFFFFFFSLNCKSVSGHIVTKAKWYIESYSRSIYFFDFLFLSQWMGSARVIKETRATLLDIQIFSFIWCDAYRQIMVGLPPMIDYLRFFFFFYSLITKVYNCPPFVVYQIRHVFHTQVSWV
jgi:hypothetical protein